MKRIVTILLMCWIAQTEAQTKNNHLVGAGIGYGYFDTGVKLKGELSLNYFYSYQYFAFKLHGGVSPFTEFGTIYRGGGELGFTTKLKHKLSWHLLVGLGANRGLKYKEDKIYFGAGSYMMSTGFSLSLTPQQYLGFNAAIIPWSKQNFKTWGSGISNGITPLFSITCNYKLNHEKNK